MTQKACEIRELDSFVVVGFLLDFSIKVYEAHCEVDGFVGLVVDEVKEDSDEFLELDFDGGELLADFINFEAIEVGEVELFIVLLKQVAGLLRVPNEVGNHLVDELLRYFL